MNFVFFGSTRFSTIVLNELKNAKYLPKLIICAPDAQAGRGKKNISPATKIWAEKNNIPVLQPKKLIPNNQYIQSNSHIGIMASYGLIIPKEIITAFPKGILNIHPSLLPRYRGPSPIQTTILNGDTETGITIMLTDEKMDHGPIITQKKEDVLSTDTYTTLHDRLAALSGILTANILQKWIENDIQLTPQNHAIATYTKLLSKEDGYINWNKAAVEIERQIKAYIEWPTSFTFWKNKRLTIIEALVENHKSETKNEETGKVFYSTDFKIICGKDVLIVKRLKLEGGKEMTGEEFLRGHKNLIGTILK